MKVSGGEVSAANGVAVYNAGTGKIYSLDGAPVIRGGVQAMNKAPVLGTGMQVVASVSDTGDPITDYVAGNIATYKYLRFVPDTTAPRMTSVTGPSNGTYDTAQNLEFEVEFDEVVTVWTSGVPYLALTIGSQSKRAAYVDGSSTTTLIFRYTVQSGDVDADGIVCASPMVLNGGSIRDYSNNNAVLTFTPPNMTGVFVNASAPAIATEPLNLTVNVGQSVAFSVAATGSAPLSYQWQQKTAAAGSAFADISGATLPTLSIPNTTYAMNGNQYRCVVSNALGTASSAAATLTVNRLVSATPTASVTTVAKTSATQPGVSFTLTNSTSYANGQTWAVYTGLTGQTLASGVTATNIGNSLTIAHATDIPAGTYYVSVTESDKTESARLALTVGAYVPPALTGTVTISGTTQYGKTLTAAYTSGNNTGTLSYQWKRGGADIGTNANTYTLVAADIGQTLTCVVTSDVQTGPVSSVATAAIGKADGPAVTGVAAVNCTTISNNDGKLTGVTTAMEYKRSGTTGYTAVTGGEITGLTSGTYQVRVKETATHHAGTPRALVIEAYVPGALTGTVTISGTTKYGERLTAAYTSGNNTGTLSYQWKRGSADIGTNANTYTLVAEDIGQTLTCVVTSDVQTGPVSSVATAAIGKADGPAVTGVSAANCTTINNNDGKLTGVTTAMEYKKSGATSYTAITGSAVTGLTSGTYLVRAKETATHHPGTPRDLVIEAYVPGALTGTATISNMAPRIGSVLTGSLTGSNNTGTLTYVWKANGTRVGAGSSYTVTAADLGKTITLEIESSVQTGTRTSAATAAVIKRAAPTAPGAPTLVSKTHDTVTLTANAAYEFSKDGAAWQSGNVFGDLTASTAYTFRQRVAETADTEASAPSAGIIVTTNSKSSGDSDDGSSPAPSAKPTEPVSGKTENRAVVDGSGTANVRVTEQNIADAIANARAVAERNGVNAGEITAVINVSSAGQSASDFNINLPRSTQQQIISQNLAGIKLAIDRPDITVGLNQAAVREINRQANADIQINVARTAVSSLSAAAQNVIGSRPVYNFRANYQSGDKNITDFGRGAVYVSIPYTPAPNEAVGYLYAVYVDGSGRTIRVPGSAYDANSGSLIFATNHFSVYGVGYAAPGTKYTDIGTHWAKDSIDYVTGRGLLANTQGKFNPDAAIARGELSAALTALSGQSMQNLALQGRAAGSAIARQELAAILQSYAKATGYKLPATRSAITFADASGIGGSYTNAVKAMQQAGVMAGVQNNRFNPTGNVTRAEVSAMLHRYIKLTIDPATAQGWAFNDDGQRLYYNNGKAVTGWQTIGGVRCFFNPDGTLKTGWVKDDANKSYYFHPDGTLARGTKIGEYEVDDNGVRKAQ